jgi:hypothetical protein
MQEENKKTSCIRCHVVLSSVRQKQVITTWNSFTYRFVLIHTSKSANSVVGMRALSQYTAAKTSKE